MWRRIIFCQFDKYLYFCTVVSGETTGHIKDVELNVLSAAILNFATSSLLQDKAITNVHGCVYTVDVYIDSVGFGVAYPQ